MEEPQNPERYYIYQGYEHINGKRVYIKAKRWLDDAGKSYERILSIDGVEEAQDVEIP